MKRCTRCGISLGSRPCPNPLCREPYGLAIAVPGATKIGGTLSAQRGLVAKCSANECVSHRPALTIFVLVTTGHQGSDAETYRRLM